MESDTATAPLRWMAILIPYFKASMAHFREHYLLPLSPEIMRILHNPPWAIVAYPTGECGMKMPYNTSLYCGDLLIGCCKILCEVTFDRDGSFGVILEKSRNPQSNVLCGNLVTSQHQVIILLNGHCRYTLTTAINSIGKIVSWMLITPSV
jgi:hypothetical protein